MSDCLTEEQLSELAECDRLPPPGSAERAHLDTCADCRAQLDQHRANMVWANDVFAKARLGDSDADTGTETKSGPARIARLIEHGILQRSDDPQTPARFGGYEIVGCIGQGGMGIVLRGRDVALNRTVAIKLIRPELADEDEITARFAHEARCAAALRHPNIVTIHATGQEHGTPFLVMEHVDGETLADRIQRVGTLPPASSGTIFRQILAGLQDAHETGLLHRDIKSSNILLDGADDQVKIADFGLARVLTHQTRITLGTAMLGSPEYMSPEQARGDQDLDPRSDLYSAGIVLYEMLTGRTPFRAETPTGVIFRILHEEPVDPRSIQPAADPRLAEIALRLTAKRPEDRFQSAVETLAALDDVRTVRQPARRRRITRRLMKIGAAATVFAALLWLGNQAWSGGGGAAAETRGPLTWIGADPNDPERKTAILARYGDVPVHRIFRDLGPRAEAVVGATLLDLDGRGSRIVVAGIAQPIDGACAFAFDTNRDELWTADLSWDQRWPDCAPPTKFRCLCLTAGDLDGRPGDELVVVASDVDEYATRVSIIDAQTGAAGATFWHTGNIDGVRIIPDLLPDDRPAIVAWGLNNKLDGFDTPHTGDDPPLTKYDMVSAVMILDPQSMSGVGPPRTEQIELPYSPPAAYAFLDHPCNEHMLPVADGMHAAGATEPSASRQLAAIGEVKRTLRRGPERAKPALEVDILGEVVSGARRARAVLVVDRDLQIVEIVPIMGERVGTTKDYWRDYWRVITKHRK